MLVLSRRVGEVIVIGGHIRVSVVETQGNQIRLGIEAPACVVVDREEVHQRRQEFRSAPSSTPLPTDKLQPHTRGRVPRRSSRTAASAV